MGDAIHHALSHAFTEAYHRDHANSAIHCSEVQYRPLTKALAFALDCRQNEVGENLPHSEAVMVQEVLR